MADGNQKLTSGLSSAEQALVTRLTRIMLSELDKGLQNYSPEARKRNVALITLVNATATIVAMTAPENFDLTVRAVVNSLELASRAIHDKAASTSSQTEAASAPKTRARPR